MHIDFSDVFAAMREAGRAIMDIYRQDFEVEWKGENDPVTQADMEAHWILMDALQSYGYPVLSEEGQDDKARFESECFWLVDPLDGTGDFIRRTDEFCVMVALMEHGEPVFGAIYLPVEDTLYHAWKGEGAFVSRNKEQEERISVSKVADPKQAHALVSRTHKTKDMDALISAIGTEKITPTGSNGIKAVRVAKGQGDFFINPTDKMHEWDIAAPQIIIEEAGGKVTGAHGEKLVYNKREPRALHGELASNGVLHKAILSAIST
ncbi:MAG: 3'(2'),5'-bisphosphate nucleotidase CysQ [bacterium]|nr:3'(2'),5'-bisphosphate nucleotidase CysQ [bacterium]